MNEILEDVAQDVLAISRIDAVPALLQFICQSTGMGFAAVARVTDSSWTACAVQDNIRFGLATGESLDVHSTLCKEARALRQGIAFDHASVDPEFREHHTPLTYKIESYISVPIIRQDGGYFGNLCAIDPQPRKVSNPETRALFTTFADLIAMQLDSQDQWKAADVARVIVRAIVNLAHGLHLEVVAEGVETAAQRDVLAEMACDELQGYFFAKPMPAEALTNWMAERVPSGVDVPANGRWETTI